MGSTDQRDDGDGPGHATFLVLVGCALFLIALFVPVMQWSVNAAHGSAGDARIWLGNGWTLADGGFEGAALLAPSSAAVLALAAVTLFLSGRRRWQFQAISTLALSYVPLWTLMVFARKWEDDVDPDVGAAMLGTACIAIALGLWAGRPAAQLPLKATRHERSQPSLAARIRGARWFSEFTVS